MENILGLLLGFSIILEPSVLLYCFIGVFLGTFIGVLPGIGALAAISLLLPLTYHIPATSAIVMLAGVYYGTQYGGSTASILLNLPGTPSSVITCIDGYPMAKKGRAGVALFITAVASFVGAMIGVLLLLIFATQISNLGLMFGPAEYFSLMLLGLISAAGIASKSFLKGLTMVVLGLLLGTVGTDINSGVSRFDFGIPELTDGISLVVIAMGLFGLIELILSSNKSHLPVNNNLSFKSMLPSIQDIKRSVVPMLRGSAIGSFFGTLPGTGPSIAAFTAYSTEKKLSTNSSEMGQGAIEGVVAPEAANNAAAQTAFIPTLSLGVPGDAIMALMLAALIIHGIQPGPMLITQQPEIFWGLVASFIIGNIFLLILNIPLIGLWVKFLQIPYHFLYPAILIFISIGVYSVNNNVFNIYSVAIVGVIGYILATAEYEFAPLILGFVLGPMIEENLRRALLMSSGDFMTFINRPISAALLGIVIFVLIFSVMKMFKNKFNYNSYSQTGNNSVLKNL
jgi:putative tricarboxylic transport membrane protein